MFHKMHQPGKNSKFQTHFQLLRRKKEEWMEFERKLTKSIQWATHIFLTCTFKSNMNINNLFFAKKIFVKFWFCEHRENEISIGMQTSTNTVICYLPISTKSIMYPLWSYAIYAKIIFKSIICTSYITPNTPPEVPVVFVAVPSWLS